MNARKDEHFIRCANELPYLCKTLGSSSSAMKRQSKRQPDRERERKKEKRVEKSMRMSVSRSKCSAK